MSEWTSSKDLRVFQLDLTKTKCRYAYLPADGAPVYSTEASVFKTANHLLPRLSRD